MVGGNSREEGRGGRGKNPNTYKMVSWKTIIIIIKKLKSVIEKDKMPLGVN